MKNNMRARSMLSSMIAWIYAVSSVWLEIYRELTDLQAVMPPQKRYSAATESSKTVPRAIWGSATL